MNKVVVTALLLSGGTLMHASGLSDQERKSVVAAPSLDLTTQKVQLPKAGIIKDRLLVAGFKDFLEDSKIDKKLGDKKLSPMRVFNIVERALDKYNKSKRTRVR